MILIDPSLASANPFNYQKAIESLGDVPRLHLDVEDGNFVPNITFGMKTIRAVADMATQKLDAHLMVTDPGLYLDDLMDAGVEAIAIHIESGIYPLVHLQKIRSRGCKAGLAFNCMAPVESALPYADQLDYLLIMTSEPDGRGQLFNPAMLGKIARARALFGPAMDIMVDGGISEALLPDVVAAGANIVVMGRAIWNAENPEAQYRRLMEQGAGNHE